MFEYLQIDMKLCYILIVYYSSRAISNMRIAALGNSSRNIGMIPLVFGLQPAAANDMRVLFQSFDTDNSG